MGRRTFQSINKSLSGRFIAVLSESGFYGKGEGVEVFQGVEKFSSLSQALKALDARGFESVFFCGGERVYQAGLKLCDKLFLTHVHKAYKGDAFFPQFDESDFCVTEKQERKEYTFLTLERVKR